jgi:hypothetical protein
MQGCVLLAGSIGSGPPSLHYGCPNTGRGTMSTHSPEYKRFLQRNGDLGLILMVGGLVIFSVAVGLLLAL